MVKIPSSSSRVKRQKSYVGMLRFALRMHCALCHTLRTVQGSYSASMPDFECVSGSCGASASTEVLRRSKPSTEVRLQITQPSLSPSIQFQPRAWGIWSGTGLQKGTNDDLDGV